MSAREKEPPPAGQMSYSIQWRCTRMHKHSGPDPEPRPCPGCYSLAETSVVIPYQPFVPWTKVAAEQEPRP